MRDSLRAPTNVSDNDSLLLSNTYNIVSSEEPFKPTRVPPLTAPARGLRRATAACRGLAAVAGTAIRDFRRNKANQQCQVWVRPAIVKKWRAMARPNTTNLDSTWSIDFILARVGWGHSGTRYEQAVTS
jgi:hypothetical protein